MERYRTTIILIAVLVVLGGLAIALGGKNPPAVPGSPTPGPTFFVWQGTDPVIAIDVVSGTKKVSLTKDISTTIWSLNEPIKSVADPFAVGNVADAFQSLQATSVLTAGNDLAQYKLDKPALTVTSTFSDTARTKRVLQVGGPTFDGSGYYTKLADQPSVYIVSNTNIEPIRSWLDTPPKFVPTPTPLLPTAAPTSAITGTLTVTGTVGITGTNVPATVPPGAGTLTPVGSSAVITGTSPGAANATTPLASPLVATATALP